MEVIVIILQKVRKLKAWEYIYDSKQEMQEHRESMLLAGFQIEKEESDLELSIEFSQVIQETE